MMISESGNANGYPWTFPKSPYPRLKDYLYMHDASSLCSDVVVAVCIVDHWAGCTEQEQEMTLVQ